MLPETTDPIRPKKLHRFAAERLQELIRERQLKPGDKLPSERELQAAFRIGRPAVREALLVLERSGLIELRSGAPATVAAADPRSILDEMRVGIDYFLATEQGVREIQEVRRLLECGLVKQAALERDEATLQRLRQILDDSRKAMNRARQFETLDVEFHATLIRVSHNRVYDAVLRAMGEWLREQRTISLTLPGQTGRALAEHEEIFAAVAAQDAAAAEKAMYTHLVHVEETYWQMKEAAEAGEAGGREGSGPV